MAMYAKKQTFEQVDPGRYHGQLTKIDVKEITSERGKSDCFQFTFVNLTPGPHQGKTIEGLTSVGWSKKTKLFKWAAALNGGMPMGTGDEEAFDVESLIGREAFLVVVDGKNERVRIDDLQPIIRDLPPAPPPTAPGYPPAPAGYAPQQPATTGYMAVPQQQAAPGYPPVAPAGYAPQPLPPAQPGAPAQVGYAAPPPGYGYPPADPNAGYQQQAYAPPAQPPVAPGPYPPPPPGAVAI